MKNMKKKYIMRYVIYHFLQVYGYVQLVKMNYSIIVFIFYIKT